MIENIKRIHHEQTRACFLKTCFLSGLGIHVSSSSLLAQNRNSSQRKIIRILLPGGMSHLDSFDPKPERADVMGATKTMVGNTDQNISAYFPRLAKMMDKFTLIRSMRSSEADHMRAQYLNMTSYPKLGTTLHPDLGAFIYKMKGSINENLPATVSIRGSGWGGYLGAEYDPFKILNSREPLRGLVMANPESDENREFLKLMSDVRRDFHKKHPVQNIDAYRLLYNHSIKFMHSKDLEAFDIKQESDALFKRYEGGYGPGLILARRLLEANVRYITINLGSWDDHFNLWEANDFPGKARKLDIDLSAFITDLYSRGLHKDVVFAVNSDFGRTPRISEGGRDHHRGAFAWMIGGAGVKSGLIYGQSDETGDSVLENPVTPIDFNATLASLIGIDLEQEIFSPDNRPFTVARGGQPIDAILS